MSAEREKIDAGHLVQCPRCTKMRKISFASESVVCPCGEILFHPESEEA